MLRSWPTLPIRRAAFDVCCVVRRGLAVERLSDEALLAGLATGDPDVALAFVRRFQAKVYGVALAILGDPAAAEDVAQQAFERAWRHAGVYDPRRGSVPAWIGTIARNLAVDAARLRRAVPVDPADLLRMAAPCVTSTETLALSSQAGDSMRSAIARLPLEQARAVVLAGIYGLSAREVAEVERVPLGTAKTRIRAAMEKLRHCLADELDQGAGSGTTPSS